MMLRGTYRLLALCFFLLIPHLAFPQDVKISATVGFGGKFYSCNSYYFGVDCSYVPIYATLQNGSKPLQGMLSLRMEEKQLRRATIPPYMRHVSLSPHEKKQVILYVLLKHWSSAQDTYLNFSTKEFFVREKLQLEIVHDSDYYNEYRGSDLKNYMGSAMLMGSDETLSRFGQKVTEFMVKVQPKHVPDSFSGLPVRVPFIADISQFSRLTKKQKEALFDRVRFGGEMFFLLKDGEDIKALLPKEASWNKAFEKYELGFGALRVKFLSTPPKASTRDEDMIRVLKSFGTSSATAILPLSLRRYGDSSEFQLNKIPQLKLPSSGGVFWLVFAYAFLMGPVLFSVLRKKTREEMAWKLIPALSLLCFSLFVFLGTRGKGEESAKLHCLMVFIEGETKGLFRCEAGLYSPSHGIAEISLAPNVAAHDLVAMKNYDPVYSISVAQHDDSWNVETRWLARTMRVFSLLGTVRMNEKIGLDVSRMAANLGLKSMSSKLSESDEEAAKVFRNNAFLAKSFFAGEMNPEQLGISKSPFKEAHVVVVIAPKQKGVNK